LRFRDVGSAAFSSSVTVRRAEELLLLDDDEGLDDEDEEEDGRDDGLDEEEGLAEEDEDGVGFGTLGMSFGADADGSLTLVYSSSMKSKNPSIVRNPM
jgi:hypothetical protein